MAAAGISDYLANKLLNFVFNGGTYSPPATVYVALFTTTLTAGGVGTEVTGGAYARNAFTANTTNFPTTTTRQVANAVASAFAIASAGWGTVQYYGIYDALTAGNLLWFGPVTPNKTVGIGDALTVSINLLIFKMTNVT